MAIIILQLSPVFLVDLHPTKGISEQLSHFVAIWLQHTQVSDGFQMSVSRYTLN